MNITEEDMEDANIDSSPQEEEDEHDTKEDEEQSEDTNDGIPEVAPTSTVDHVVSMMERIASLNGEAHQTAQIYLKLEMMKLVVASPELKDTFTTILTMGMV
jgi:hypothetical protein